MPEEKFDAQEQRRRALEAAPPETSDALIVMQENARKIREESARLKAERDKQEQFQRDRQAMHEELARRESDAIRAKIFMRVWEAEEAAKAARAQVEASLGTPSPSYRNEALELEQEAGRRALLRHAGRAQEAAAAREKIKVEEKDTAPLVSGFKVQER